ncbi:IclR family transcriptional regulator [Acuticoccus mangrovi]|uniref:IclR family transcriptional regulator n=1 Tax=Acuticoccus mangrovi TaxID=2796142 RepID=A0A934IQH1_9HYPH|nr:IclR family transcriptional regulator [Acuticoccus mangrovi]MBJ3775749.1 IclR family transcriptional regulator [Acuticoccus mangrovi]
MKDPAPSPGTPADAHKEQKVEAVERALTILEAFADGSPRLTLSEITKRTGFYRSTVLRLYASLARFDYLHRDEDGHFRLGPSLWRLGNLYQSAFNLADRVRPVLARIAEETGETATFYVRRGNMRLCLYRQHSSRTIRHVLEEGAMLPIDRGASGRVLIAYSGGEGPFFEAIREAGYYLSLGERDPDIAGLSVPVLATGGALVGALNVSGLKSRFEAPGAVERLLPILQEEAQALGRRLANV